VLLLANDVTHIERARQVLDIECALPRNSLNAIELAKARFADLALYYLLTDTAVSYCAGTTTTKQLR
jgi:hypothetical protein